MANLKHHTIRIHGGFLEPLVHFVRTVCYVFRIQGQSIKHCLLEFRTENKLKKFHESALSMAGSAA